MGLTPELTLKATGLLLTISALFSQISRTTVALAENEKGLPRCKSLNYMVGRIGFEPMTTALKALYSAITFYVLQ